MNITMYIAHETPKGEYETIDVVQISLVEEIFRALQALQALVDELNVTFRVELFIQKERDR